jgi:hypothetical protein
VKNVTEPANAAVMFVVGLAKCNKQSDPPNKHPRATPHASAGGAARRVLDLAQKLLSAARFILRRLRESGHARRLDHLRDSWRSRQSASVASSDTVEGQKRRSRKSASLTYNFGRRCASYGRLAVCPPVKPVLFKGYQSG